MKPRVFISHSSLDKVFVGDLASKLASLEVDVWYDDWEIAVGDSIVEKVFAALQASDSLLIVLSPASVASRWVREELSVAVMRRLSECDIRIFPVLAATCEIPVPLKHIRYADFRNDPVAAFDMLVEGISPTRVKWVILRALQEQFDVLCDDIRRSAPADSADQKLLEVYTLLEQALDVRTEIEFRDGSPRSGTLRFFDKIQFLVEKGIDLRSVVWNALVHYVSCIMHTRAGARLGGSMQFRIFAEMLDSTGYFYTSPMLGPKRPRIFPGQVYNEGEVQMAIGGAMDELVAIMNLLCVETWPRRINAATTEDV